MLWRRPCARPGFPYRQAGEEEGKRRKSPGRSTNQAVGDARKEKNVSRSLKRGKKRVSGCQLDCCSALAKAGSAVANSRAIASANSRGSSFGRQPAAAGCPPPPKVCARIDKSAWQSGERRRLTPSPVRSKNANTVCDACLPQASPISLGYPSQTAVTRVYGVPGTGILTRLRSARAKLLRISPATF